MSKTQDKKAARIAEAAAFVKERRIQNLNMYEQSFKAGVQMLESQKENLSPEDLEVLEKQKAETEELIAKMKEELGLDVQVD
jgi:HPt (histidine-containing phosphotransfer) domain-containing protein